MTDFGVAERRILSYFKAGTMIMLKGKELIVKEVGKPTCPQGEPKTDIYVLTTDGTEIKISYKKENADFLENKTNAVRAEQLFGSNWRGIIEHSTEGISDQFRKRMLIYKEKLQRTEKGAITLGWKFELLNKAGGDLSGKMDLTYQQVYDVYAGTNLSDDKRNASVNGRIIENSGVADYILVTDDVSSAQDIIDQMYTIDEYIRKHPDIYFVCKALNYRTFAKKYDGNRPLAVQVDWSVNNGKLSSELVFDKPLEMNGDVMAKRLLRCLEFLKIKTTDDIDGDNANMDNVNE
ncbi:MAG: hypothetical protein J6P16_05495 [Eubacterium sp.]|nr:hypothetical protein [Eubacterium sp.]